MSVAVSMPVYYAQTHNNGNTQTYYSIGHSCSMTAAELLKALMEQRGDNPNSLSRKSKVPQSTIFRFLAGTAKEPRLSTLEKIARTYNVPVEVFLSSKARGEYLETLGLECPAESLRPTDSSWPFLSFTAEEFDSLPDLYKGRVEQAALAIVHEWQRIKKSA